jgi:phage head maturation protease
MTDKHLHSLVATGRATLDEMARLGADAVAAIKTSRDIQQIRVKAAEPIAKNEEARTISYLVSDETPDRMGDVIRVRGWDLANYKRNPVVLWGHNANMPPIGRSGNVRRRYGPARLTSDIEFAPKEAYEFADTIYQLANRGFLKATSVGFMPTATEDVDDNKRKKLGMGPYGQLYVGAELMEISVVAVPANPSALEEGVKQLVGEGILSKSMVPRFLESYPATADQAVANIRKRIRSFIDMGALTRTASTMTELTDEAPEPEVTPTENHPAAEQSVEGVTTEQAVEPAEVAPEVETKTPDGVSTKLVSALSVLIEQQAEQTRATRQLVDGLTDLVKSLHQTRSEARGGSSEPEAAPSEAARAGEDVDEETVNSMFRGFAESWIRRNHYNPNA